MLKYLLVFVAVFVKMHLYASAANFDNSIEWLKQRDQGVRVRVFSLDKARINIELFSVENLDKKNITFLITGSKVIQRSDLLALYIGAGIGCSNAVLNNATIKMAYNILAYSLYSGLILHAKSQYGIAIEYRLSRPSESVINGIVLVLKYSI